MSVLSLVIAVYAFFFWRSIRQVDDFCNSIAVSMKTADLPALAKRANVELRGPMEAEDSAGKYLFAVAASGFTIGEYACRVRGSYQTKLIVSKRLGY